jgi:hypothetical protein
MELNVVPKHRSSVEVCKLKEENSYPLLPKYSPYHKRRCYSICGMSTFFPLVWIFSSTHWCIKLNSLPSQNKLLRAGDVVAIVHDEPNVTNMIRIIWKVWAPPKEIPMAHHLNWL